MLELEFIKDAVEEQIIRGNLRWLANFNEIRRDYALGEIVFPIYASGGLQERGFLLSKVFSALVTPKFRVHFFLYTCPSLDTKIFRKIVTSLKGKFGRDDWILLSLVQNQPISKDLKNAVKEVKDKNLGVTISSLESRENLPSENVLGKGLIKQFKVTEARFEAFDLPNYLKSFTIVVFLGVFILVFLAISGFSQAVHPLTLLLLVFFSFIAGHKIYKSRYHTKLTLTSDGFRIQEGQRVTEGKWHEYKEATFYITPNRETYIRLYSEKGKVDIPVSRAGIPRKEAYNTIQRLMRTKQLKAS
ncbi:MAG: hypothetical protein QXN87_05175 [Candidatus Bathyarchaeia archaeon]